MLSITKAPTPPTHELWQVVEIGDVRQLVNLLAQGVDVNARNEAGMTPLMVAAYLGRLEIVRALSERGADINATDSQGFTAAMLADNLGHEEIVRVLVARGVKKNDKPKDTESPVLQSPSLITESSPTEAVKFDDVSAHDVTPDVTRDVTPEVRNPEVRTLHEPPDIWNLVPETSVEFHPGSAFFGKLPSLKQVTLTVLVLIVVAGAVFGFLKLRSLSETDHLRSTRAAAASVRAEPPTSTVSSQPVAPKPVTPEPSPIADDSASSIPQVTESTPPTVTPSPEATVSSNRTSEKVNSAIPVAPFEATNEVAPAAVPAKRVVVNKHRRTNPTIPTPIEQAAVARTEDEGKTRAADPVPNDVKIASPAPNNVKTASSTPAKKEESKTPGQQSPAPASASATPKAKVIQWP